MRVGGKPYPWSVKDAEFGNAKMDEMHKEKRLEWMMQPTPFGSPVFVVWRQVDGKSKGRLVADLRMLNKAVVPDAYPLPSQEDIIKRIQGKKFLRALDASNFFLPAPNMEPHRSKTRQDLVTSREVDCKQQREGEGAGKQQCGARHKGPELDQRTRLQIHPEDSRQATPVLPAYNRRDPGHDQESRTGFFPCLVGPQHLVHGYAMDRDGSVE
jgi:hypothetical protein